MATWVALLRAVNVGGRKVPMADLRALCEELGLEDVRTYIASGNVVFRSPLRSAARVRELLEPALEERFGFPVVVVVRSPTQLRAVVDGLPFDDPEHAHVSFLVDGHEVDQMKDLQDSLINDAQLTVKGDHAYLLTPKGLGQGFLKPGADRRFGKVGTARNWRTVLKLTELAEES